MAIQELLKRNVDLVEYDTIRPEIRENIIRDEISILSRDLDQRSRDLMFSDVIPMKPAEVSSIGYLMLCQRCKKR